MERKLSATTMKKSKEKRYAFLFQRMFADERENEHGRRKKNIFSRGHKKYSMSSPGFFRRQLLFFSNFLDFFSPLN